MAVRSLSQLIDQTGVSGKRVLLRADLNVPLRDGRISDDTRIRASLPSLQRLLAAGARVVLCSHLGRPKGQRVPTLSLQPVADALGALLGKKVGFVHDCVGGEALAASRALADGELLLLENLRFHAEETKNDPEFARALAQLGDIYVNDAFGTAHRAHASTAGVAEFIDTVAAGELMATELQQLQKVLQPKRPLLCLLGGAKVSDKLPVLEALAPHANVLCIGGAMAYTFLQARGEPVGTSLTEPEQHAAAGRVEAAAREAGCELLLPLDHVVAEKLEADAPSRVVEQIPDGFLGVDIGPKTTALYAQRAAAAGTIFWNGPMGVFEMPPFAAGTKAVAEAVASSHGHSVVGGGDSLAAVNALGAADRIDHLSTGGGAALEFIQGLTLPGVAALERA